MMKATISLRNGIFGLIMVLIASGCQPNAAVPQTGATTVPAILTTALPAGQADAFPTENPAPISTTAPEVVSLENGYILFDSQNSAFIGYAPDGSLLFSAAAPGIRFPSMTNTYAVKDAVYFKTDETGQVFRTSASGVEPVKIPTKNLSFFSVSRDEKYIAWSNLDPQNGNSELWVASRDGSDARQVARYAKPDSSTFETLAFIPIEWTAEGKLLFDRQITGIGGYILFAGHNGLYSYNPETGQIANEIPARDMTSVCLDSYRLDLQKAVYNCGMQGPDLIIRDLRTQKETTLARLPGQGVTGAARYSPSGKWLAYAIAKGDPENENGQVIIVPANLDAAPAVIARVADKSYAYVQGWLDEDTLLFSRNTDNGSTLWAVNVDGSGLKQVGAGMFIGWMR